MHEMMIAERKKVY